MSQQTEKHTIEGHWPMGWIIPNKPEPPDTHKAQQQLDALRKMPLSIIPQKSER